MAASGEKPYRVYRGGRAKGKVPLTTRERDVRRRDDPRRRGPDRDGRQVGRRPRRWTWKRWTWVSLLVLLVLLVVWSVAGYLSVRSGEVVVTDGVDKLQPGAKVIARVAGSGGPSTQPSEGRGRAGGRRS